ncbi:hypothetical protein FACS189426_12250 [Bacteroidia bacterium]|nr:hypothetical protein FACS189426_12250 [Bacteroidia bacterium]
MKKIILLSIALITTGFLAATAQNNISSQKYQEVNASFEYPDFETPKLPMMKQAKSGQDWWVPDKIYGFAIRPEGETCVDINTFEYYYDPQGLFVLTESTSFNSRVNPRLLTYTYDSNQNLLSRLQQSWGNNSWSNYYLSTYTYNSNQNLQTKQYHVWRNDSWENSGSYTYTYIYDSNQNLQAELSYTWRNDSWENTDSVTYTYDSNNNILNILRQSWANNSWQNISLSTYTYDSNNNRLTDIFQNWENNSWINGESVIFTYDSNHNKLSILRQSWANNSWQNISLSTNTYDSNHNLLTELQQEWKNNSWVNVKQYLMTYDENNNGTSAKYWMWRNESWQPSGYNDVTSSITLWLYYNNMQSVFEGSCDKLTASYTKVSAPTAIIEPSATPGLNDVSIYPNPTTGELRIENGELKIQQISIFNMLGLNVLNTQQTTFDISHLPVGIYFVQIKTEKGMVAKKIVLQNAR